MELIVIDESKVKVMLSAKDMRRFELDVSDMDYEDRHTRIAIKAILEAVRIKSGLDVMGEKMLVQVYPAKDGGCEMFISRLSPPIKSGATPKSLTLLSTKNKMYCFEVFEHLLEACSALHKNGYSMESALYSMDEKWYLHLQENHLPVNESKNHIAFVSEYATQTLESITFSHVKEHGRCIMQNDAVQMLANLSVK